MWFQVISFPVLELLPLTETKGTDAKHHAEAPSATGDRIGTATIGQTSTYSSHPLTTGDAVGSVVDSSSNDPITYKMPEHTYGSGAGVPSGAAGAAASLAFNKDRDQSSM